MKITLLFCSIACASVVAGKETSFPAKPLAKAGQSVAKETKNGTIVTGEWREGRESFSSVGNPGPSLCQRRRSSSRSALSARPSPACCSHNPCWRKRCASTARFGSFWGRHKIMRMRVSDKSPSCNWSPTPAVCRDWRTITPRSPTPPIFTQSMTAPRCHSIWKRPSSKAKAPIWRVIPIWAWDCSAICWRACMDAVGRSSSASESL